MGKYGLRVVPWALLAMGCAADGEAMDASGTEGSTGPSSTGTSDGADSTGADSTGTEPAAPLARGVRISLVEANAGVAIPIGRDGEWVDGDGRNGPILQNRETAVRIRVDVDEAVWTVRDIEAQLRLHLPDGTVETISAVETISGDSADDTLESNFMLTVPAELMVNLLQFEVELFEAGATGWEGIPEPDPAAPRLPSTGTAFVGVEDSVQNMRIVLVPVQYESPECTATFDTSEETIAEYSDAMFQHNPLDTIEFEIHEPYLVDDLDLSDANDFFQLLERMQQLRAQEKADPNVYYYGIFDNCAQCVGFMGLGGCVLGVAAGLPDAQMGSAAERVAIGASQLDDPGGGGILEIGATTFVHEIGHTQGRQHVACPGVNAGGPDLTYPYEDGLIGVWGYGVLDEQLRSAADHTDYMSYCNPTWVSDWQWRATYARIAELSSWDAAGMAGLDQHGVLVGSVDTRTGRTRWWTDRGYVTRPTDDHLMRLTGADGQVIEQLPVQVSAWSEGPWMTVRAPLTAAFDEATTLELVAPTARYSSPRSEVAEYHRPTSLTDR